LPFWKQTYTCKVPGVSVEIDENSPVGLHIKKRRLKLKLSQGQVARMIGVVDEAIYTWETGLNHPQIQYAPKIIQFLGYNPYPIHETDTFGGKIKLYRLLHGLSYRKMAKVLNADSGTVAQWESNETIPSKMRLNELTALLQFEIKTLGEATYDSSLIRIARYDEMVGEGK